MVLTIEFLILFGLAFLLLFYEPKGTLTSLMVIGTTGYLFYLSYQKKKLLFGVKKDSTLMVSDSNICSKDLTQ